MSDTKRLEVGTAEAKLMALHKDTFAVKYRVVKVVIEEYLDTAEGLTSKLEATPSGAVLSNPSAVATASPTVRSRRS